jgi:hypothetical protein
MATSPDDTPWFRVLMAVRWPVALVATAGILGGVLLHVLSRPIPIRLAMPLDQPLAVQAEVEQLNGPIKVEEDEDGMVDIRIHGTVPVNGTVGVNSRTPIPITGEPKVVVTNPVEVTAKAALPVKGSVDVKHDDVLPIQVKGDVGVVAPAPLKVETEVKLDTDDNPVQIQVKEGLMGIF